MKTLIRDQYLSFNGIKLVSVYSDDFPYNRERCKDMWHVPGRTIMDTAALLDLAIQRKVSLNRTEFSDGIATTTRLI